MDNFLLNLLFPKFCLGCQKEGTFLCQDCRHLLDISESNYCLCETNPLRLPSFWESGKCSRCMGSPLSGLYFALSYKEKPLVKKLIYQFKYQPYLKDLAGTLASILAEHFIKTGKNTNQIWKNSALIPVPLHTKKLRQRGYNQSEELAKELSKIINVPVLSDVLIKIKYTSPQMMLKRGEREKNLKNAFKINPAGSDASGGIKNKKLFLIDDVYTTGFTMSECAKVLKLAGAKEIWGLTLAREG